MSCPNVYDTPRSFSPQPVTSLSGSDHRRSHKRPKMQQTNIETITKSFNADHQLWSTMFIDDYGDYQSLIA